MRKKYILQLCLITAVGGGLLSPDGAQAQLPDPTQDHTHIGFSQVISDAEVLQFVQRHNVVLQAVFLWAAGFGGTHRAYEAKSAQALLQEARDKTVESFGKSLQNSPRAIQHFVQQHPEEEVMANEGLQTQARSLLNLRANVQIHSSSHTASGFGQVSLAFRLWSDIIPMGFPPGHNEVEMHMVVYHNNTGGVLHTR